MESNDDCQECLKKIKISQEKVINLCLYLVVEKMLSFDTVSCQSLMQLIKVEFREPVGLFDFLISPLRPILFRIFKTRVIVIIMLKLMTLLK